jgi:uncharacterized RDD family membrane protein YckC
VSESFNPYSPPKANVDAAEQPVEIDPVGKGKRFATYLIDYAGIYALAFISGFLVTVIFGQAGLQVLLSVNEILLTVLFFFVYYLVFEGLWARTPAKFILGTVVVTEDGGKPAFGTIVIRTLCRFIPFEPFSFFGERGWHDGISKTYVVSTRG